MTTHHFFLQYPLCAVGPVSLCRRNWVSIGVSVFRDNARERRLNQSPAFLGHQGLRGHIPSGVCYGNMFMKPPLCLGSSNTVQPFNCFLQLSHLM